MNTLYLFDANSNSSSGQNLPIKFWHLADRVNPVEISFQDKPRPNCICVHLGWNKLLLSASSQYERDLWLVALKKAVQFKVSSIVRMIDTNI